MFFLSLYLCIGMIYAALLIFLDDEETDQARNIEFFCSATILWLPSLAYVFAEERNAKRK